MLKLEPIDRPLLMPADFQEMLDTGASKLWTGRQSAIMLHVEPYHRSGELVMEAGPASGDLQEIVSVIPMLEKWSRSLGCTQSHIHAGRYGWRRVLEAQGYELFQIVMRKVLA